MRVIEDVVVEHDSNELLKSFLSFIETYDDDSAYITYTPMEIPGRWSIHVNGNKAKDATKATRWVNFVAKKSGIKVLK